MVGALLRNLGNNPGNTEKYVFYPRLLGEVEYHTHGVNVVNV